MDGAGNWALAPAARASPISVASARIGLVAGVEGRGDAGPPVGRYRHPPARFVGADAVRLRALVDDPRVAPQADLEQVDGHRFGARVGQLVTHAGAPAVAVDPRALLDDRLHLDVERLSGSEGGRSE